MTAEVQHGFASFQPRARLLKLIGAELISDEVVAVTELVKNAHDADASVVSVRFIGAGQYSLDIEVFAYIRTSDYDEFLKIQQDLLLTIMDAISAAGTALALPTQASVVFEAAARAEDLANGIHSKP